MAAASRLHLLVSLPTLFSLQCLERKFRVAIDNKGEEKDESFLMANYTLIPFSSLSFLSGWTALYNVS